MIGVAICGGLVCAFCSGYCMGYLIFRTHKQRRDSRGRFTK